MIQPTKNIKITIPAKLHIDFRNRLLYDEMTMMTFFSYIIHEYANNSELMMQVVCDIMDKRKLRSKRLIENKARLTKKGKINLKKNFLSDDEIEVVYDVIERYDINEV
tara:strand:+ start:336 stop:659 length:324 start_codon:yes stop_codon:yes gene_type:complete